MLKRVGSKVEKQVVGAKIMLFWSILPIFQELDGKEKVKYSNQFYIRCTTLTIEPNYFRVCFIMGLRLYCSRLRVSTVAGLLLVITGLGFYHSGPHHPL